MPDALLDWSSWLDFFRSLKLTIVYDEFDRQRFLWGIANTALLSILTVVLSLVVGAAGAWLQTSRFLLVRLGVQGYIEFFRNTPPLIQLYFFYFAADAVAAQYLGVRLFGSFGWAAFALTLYAGAYNVEILRSGMEAVPKTTIEAAESLGYSGFGTYRYVVLPLAIRTCLPALNNNLVNLVKTTTLAYAISVPETLWVANQIWSDALNTFTMMNVVWLVYIALVGILVLLAKWLERALEVPGLGEKA